MNQLKKIAAVLLALSLTTLFAQAATHEKPDAIVRLKGGSIAAGIGFSWGGGTLTYKGKDYAVSVDGLSLGKLGITGGSATGEVYGLKNLKDFDGHYGAAAAGMTVIAGRTAVALKNQNDVRVFFVSTTRGADVTIGGGGVKMKLKK